MVIRNSRYVMKALGALPHSKTDSEGVYSIIRKIKRKVRNHVQEAAPGFDPHQKAKDQPRQIVLQIQISLFLLDQSKAA